MAVIVALFLVALLVLVALVVDLGGLYDHDRELQAAADAAALAGAQELILTNGNQGAAADQAREYVSENTAPTSSISSVVEANLDPWSPAVDARSVTIDLRETGVPFSFARVIGRESGAVTAHARAEVKYLTGVDTLFPVALMMMKPEKFRFVFRDGSTVVGSFEIIDEDGDGWYGEGGAEGGATLPAVGRGRYEVDLLAIGEDAEGNEVVGLELEDIGYWWVSDPANPAERLYEVGMSRSGGTVTVRAEVNPAGVPPGQNLEASLGGNDFTLVRQGEGVYQGTVSAPTGTDNNTGYGVHALSVRFPKHGTFKKETITCARYVAFHSDVPLKYLMMEPSFSAGYSRRLGQSRAFQWAEIEVDNPEMWDYYTMKLGAHEGSGLYSGNWRAADIYKNHNLRDELGTVDPAILDSWTLVTLLYIGGPLWPQTGVAGGQVEQGLEDRRSNWQALYPDDPEGWRTVLVPFVNYDPNLAGGSQHYVIQMFAAFSISEWDKGEITGQFIRWVAPGEWSDEPSGPLYVETAVLTE